MDVGVAEAKDRFSELIERAEHGEPVTITRHGRPVATLTPARAKPTRAQLEQLFHDIERDKQSLPLISADEILEAIRDGRRM